MAKELAWTLRLIDKLSGVTNVQNRAVGRLDRTLRKLDRTSKRVSRSLGSIGSGPISTGLASVGTKLGSIALQATAAAGALALIGGGLLVKTTSDLQSLAEDSEFALSKLLRSQEAGADAMARARDVAEFVRGDQAEIIRQFTDFAAKGFSVDEIESLTKSIADLGAIDPGANLEGIQRAIGQIAGKGRLQGDELLQLAENGLETSSVYAALEKQLGKTRKEILAMQQAGEIDADTAIAAIQSAINDQAGGGDAGELARSKGVETISGLVNSLKSLGQGFLLDLDVDGAPVRDLLRNLVELGEGGALDPLSDALGDLGSTILETLDGVDEGDLKGILGAITDGVKFAEKAFIRTRRAVRETGESIEEIGEGPTVSLLVASLGGLALAAEGLNSIGFDPFTDILDAALFGGLKFVDFVLSIPEMLGGVGELFLEVGSDMIDGLVQGIENNAQAVADAVIRAADNAVDAAKSILGIASPSKVFADIGGFTAEGFAVGIDSGASDAQKSMANLVSPGALQVGAQAGFGGPVSSSNTDSRVFNITVNAPAGDAKSIAGAVEQVLASL